MQLMLNYNFGMPGGLNLFNGQKIVKLYFAHTRYPAAGVLLKPSLIRGIFGSFIVSPILVGEHIA